MNPAQFSSSPERASHARQAAIIAALEGLMMARDRPLSSAIVKYFGKKPIVVDEDVKTGIRYPTGEGRLGSDRSVACVAAMEKYGTPLVVLDFGTATTVDALDRDGVYRGGCILAGMRIFADTLAIGYPLALEARAEERDTLGLTSIT